MKNITFKTVYMWVLIICGIIGLFAATTLTWDKLKIAADPSYIPNCSISPVVACSPVISSHQGSAFGIPNPFIGIAAFAMVLTVGMMLLAGGVIKKKWFWWCFQAGSLFGVLFISWLINASVYDIGKLCIYCMVTWAVTIPVFWTTLSFNLREKNINIKGKVGLFFANNPGKLIALSYLVVITLVFTHFADYFHSLI